MSDDEMINAGIKSPDEIFRDKRYSLVQDADKALMERFAAFDEALALLKEVDKAYRRDAIFDEGKPRLYLCLCGAGRDSDHFPDCRLAAFLKKWGQK